MGLVFFVEVLYEASEVSAAGSYFFGSASMQKEVAVVARIRT
jgi:hypothetical protein